MNSYAKNQLLIQRLGNEIAIFAEQDALWIRYEGIDPNISLSRRVDWLKNQDINPFGQAIAPFVEQLIESELAESLKADLRIEYQNLYIIDKEYNFIKNLAPWAPFSLAIVSEGALGMEKFKYDYQYYLGPSKVFPHRFGCFLQRSSSIFRMDQGLFELVETLDDFNQQQSYDYEKPTDYKTKSLEVLFKVKKLAEEVGAKIDNYLDEETVLCPNKIKIGVFSDPEGRISLFPIIPDSHEDEIRKAFMVLGEIPPVLDIVKDDGSRDRVLLEPEIQETLSKLQKVRHVSGRTKAQALADPTSFLEGSDLSLVDMDGYGPRVRDIGDYPKDVRAYVRRRSIGFLEDTEVPEMGLKCVYSDGSEEEIKFESLEEGRDLLGRVSKALRSDESNVHWHGKELPVNTILKESLEEVLDTRKTLPSADESKPTKPGRYLIIYTNEPEVEYIDHKGDEIKIDEISIPQSLENPTILKTHQTEGIRWFQRLFGKSNHRGALLADEMGLGKTLQVLSFMAWYFEKYEKSKPSLAVMPLMLLENEVWLKDIQSFFHSQGNIFMPWLILHGKSLERCKEIHVDGRETHLGEPTLRWRELANYRLIFTNYQTVVNYQFSLGKLQWGLLITDEGQYFKEPKTLVSRALKALNADFRITLTGTPVENSLMDLWNLMDFLQPGLLLSAREFAKRYIDDIATKDQNIVGQQQKIDELRQKLGVGRPEGFILRRSKENLVGLPHKHEHVIENFLSDEQRRQHIQLISRARIAKASSKGTHFTILHELVKLYQHPMLISGSEAPILPSEQLINDSPKLHSVLKKLQEISKVEEKVLIFTRYRYMQAILQTVIENEFNIKVNIINGSLAPKTGRSRSNRHELLNLFQQQYGFQVLILSPQVAGLGLNIVEANHVIHYGRWWNPALEDQSTDRVYRIGQTRDVHVYYPVSLDPLNQFTSFDQKLNQLLAEKKKLRFDFLAPVKAEDSLADELISNLLNDSINNNQGEQLPITIEELSNIGPDEFEAFVGALFSSMNFNTILTPLVSDGGIDVIGLNNEILYFVECKHLRASGAISSQAVNQLLDGYEYYNTHLLPINLRSLQVHLLLVTNGKIDNNAIKLAQDREVELWDLKIIREKIRNYKVSLLDIKMIQSERCYNLKDVKNKFMQI